MLSIKNMSFKHKLLLYAASATSTALALCCIAVMTAEWTESRREFPRNLGIQADTIGLNARAALTFDDRASAEETLRGLKADENIILACICSRDGTEFAEYRRHGSENAVEEPVGLSDYRFSGDRLHLRRPIVLDGEQIGSIYVQYDLRDFYGDLQALAVILAVGMLVALVGAALVSSRVLRVLTRPVTELAKTAQAVAQSKDYSVRAVKHSADEFGALTDTFNDMLSQIEQRDSALQGARAELEQRVEERTVELATANEDLSGLYQRLASTAEELKGLMEKVTEGQASSVRFVNPSLVRCWEAKGCEYQACPAYGHEGGPRCWEVAGTLCGGVVQGVFAQKLEDCRQCEVYQHTREDSIGALGETFNEMIAMLEQRQQALEGAVEVAEIATVAKSEFLANMSHEIRTPMTAILGFTDNLLDADLSESERINAIHTVRRNGEYLINIINDILDLSKIEAGRIMVEHIACKPCQVIAEVASLMRVRADENGLPLKVEYNGTIPETIRSDPTRIRQILVNLIGNAIKFTEAGAVHLVTRFVDDGELHLQFDVSDTGRGMTKEQVAKLFQPFTQADASTTREFGGTGLGLTISKRFAEMLGGDIVVVESKEHVGTTVRATLATGPLAGVKMLDDPISATLVADAPHTGACLEQSDLDGCLVLLAEDGPDNQHLISFVLKKARADVVIVENGKLAVDAALAARDEARPFDAILMDMQMPVMDGYEATSLLRQEGYTGSIIALTAHAMEGDREKCIKAGCDDYVAKPIDRKQLVDTIQACLPNTAVEAPAIGTSSQLSAVSAPGTGD